MNKQEIYELLDRLSIWHEITEHPAVYNMEEVAALQLPHPEADAKNLFLRDRKKRHYYMLTAKGERRVDLKDFAAGIGEKQLGFASEDDLSSILGLIAGAVTPLGLLNDPENRVILYLDESLLDPPGLIGIHPNDNTATVWMRTSDLLELLRGMGCHVAVVSL